MKWIKDCFKSFNESVQHVSRSKRFYLKKSDRNFFENESSS